MTVGSQFNFQVKPGVINLSSILLLDSSENHAAFRVKSSTLFFDWFTSFLKKPDEKHPERFEMRLVTTGATEKKNDAIDLPTVISIFVPASENPWRLESSGGQQHIDIVIWRCDLTDAKTIWTPEPQQKLLAPNMENSWTD